MSDLTASSPTGETFENQQREENAVSDDVEEVRYKPGLVLQPSDKPRRIVALVEHDGWSQELAINIQPTDRPVSVQFSGGTATFKDATTTITAEAR